MKYFSQLVPGLMMIDTMRLYFYFCAKIIGLLQIAALPRQLNKNLSFSCSIAVGFILQVFTQT